MKQEINTGYYLNGVEAFNFHNGLSVVPEVFILKVEGGSIYYRDVIIHEDDKVTHISQTAIFIPDNQDNI